MNVVRQEFLENRTRCVFEMNTSRLGVILRHTLRGRFQPKTNAGLAEPKNIRVIYSIFASLSFDGELELRDSDLLVLLLVDANLNVEEFKL